MFNFVSIIIFTDVIIITVCLKLFTTQYLIAQPVPSFLNQL